METRFDADGTGTLMRCVLAEAAETGTPRSGIRLRAGEGICAASAGQPGKHIWLMGGGELIASFLDAAEIDEFDIHVIPTLIGAGIPLMAPRHRAVALRLRSARKYPDGVVRLRYKVCEIASEKAKHSSLSARESALRAERG